jgi:hypothetical protein
MERERCSVDDGNTSINALVVASSASTLLVRLIRKHDRRADDNSASWHNAPWLGPGSIAPDHLEWSIAEISSRVIAWTRR